MTKIAFIGLGLMGQGMANNLLKCGHELTVWNRSSDKVQALVDAGAKTARSPAQAVQGAEVIITIVGDDAASQSVWLGEDGILSGDIPPHAIAIESTTISRDWMEKLGTQCIEAGLRFLDCPVTGGPAGAESGQLSLLIGGEAETVTAAEPVLNAYAKKIFHFGPVGTGTAYKLIVNSVGAVQVAALAEAMIVADKAGLDVNTVAEALCSGSVASRVVGSNAQKMASDNHDEVAFATKWRAKDVAYGAALSDSLGCTTEIFRHVASVFQRATEAGLGEANESAILRILKNEGL